jgi:AraC family transcriptional regulator, transcriptional activator of the genes for pyochelin and ferripyochelin receptors
MRLNINVNRPTGRQGDAEDENRTTFEWSGETASGPFGFINLRPGLDIVVGVRSAHRYPKLMFELGAVPLELAFHIYGTRRYRICFTHARKREVVVRAGQCALAYLPFCHGEVEHLGNHDHVCLSVYITRRCLHAYFAGHGGNIPGILTNFVSPCGCDGDPILKQFQSTAGVDAIVHQILNCPYRGALGHMYLEGKTLELLAMVFSMGNGQQGATASLSNAEQERIHTARHHLLKNLGNPPNLDALSRIAGMNRNKLNHGFKALYGASVFEVLRREKLNRALRLLCQKDLNVAQVAHEAGFKSHSHFTTAFVKSFNLSPHAYRKRIITDPCSMLPVSCQGRRPADAAFMEQSMPAVDPSCHERDAYNLVKLLIRGRL